MAENGTPLDIYEIKETIGKGGGGTVYKAVHKRLQKDVVIKKIHDSVKEEDRRNEVDVLKNLKHSYIPSVLDYFTIDGVSYTVMDYIEGESFQSLLDKGVKFKESQVIKYGKQLCEAVEYLHSRKIPVIHGDIKPDNIMLKPDDDICLIDFNISGISEGNKAYTNGFTKGYSAPEQEKAFYEIVEAIKSGKTTMSAPTVAKPAAEPAKPAPKAAVDSDVTETVDSLVDPDATATVDSLIDSDVTETVDAIVDSDVTETVDSIVDSDITETVDSIVDSDVTETVDSIVDSDVTEVLDAAAGKAVPQTEVNAKPVTGISAKTGSTSELPKIPIDKRSDVFSIGATLYHIYTGTRLDKADKKVLKASTSEGYLYILNKALQENPANRFASAGDMLKAFNNIHSKEKEYRAMVVRQNVVRIALLLLLVAGVGLVSYGLQKKKVEKEDLYVSYLEQMNTFDRNGDEAAFNELYENAVALKPDEAAAYKEKALFLYQRKQYEDAIAFTESALSNAGVYESAEVADLYYICGNSHYMREEYEEASAYFQNALKYDPGNADLNGDYAISLAKTGNLDGAADAAGKAESYGISDSNLALIHGEIEYAKGNYKDAEKYLKECIQTTDDEYRKMCAYITCGKAMSASGTKEDIDSCIDFLTAGVSDVGIEYRGYVTGLLSEAYIQGYGLDTEDLEEKDRYCDGAIKYLDELIESGWASYSTYNNLVILCTNSARFDEAEKYLDKMEERFRDNYNVPKRRAFLELEIQSAKEESDRDFSKFLEYYNAADQLYREQGGEKVDPEMKLLKDDLQVLKDGNWLK